MSKRWYVVHAYSGFENQVKRSLDERIKRAEMEEKFRLMAQKHLSAERVDNLLRLLWGIEKVPQVGTILAATQV